MICEGRVPSGGPFAHGGSASCFLGVELAAQAAAAFEAVRSSADGGLPRIGYLASIRDARFEVPSLPAGPLLLTRVRRQGGVAPLSLYSAEVTLAEDGKPLCTATFSTYSLRPE